MSSRPTRTTRATARWPAPHAPGQGKGEATRQRLLAVAADLFHAQGVDGTGLEEILRKAGAGKSQFYQHFPSKEALVREVAAWWERHLCASLDEGPGLDSLDDLEAWLLAMVDQLDVERCRRGCPVGTLAAGLHETDEATRAAVGQCFQALATRLYDVLSRLQREGKLHEGADPEALTHFLLASQQGAATLTKAYGDSGAGRAAISQAMRHVRSYSPGGP